MHSVCKPISISLVRVDKRLSKAARTFLRPGSNCKVYRTVFEILLPEEREIGSKQEESSTAEHMLWNADSMCPWHWQGGSSMEVDGQVRVSGDLLSVKLDDADLN